MASMRTEIWRVPAGTAAEAVRATSAVAELRSVGVTVGRPTAPPRAPPAAFRKVAVTAAWSVCVA